MSEWKRFIEKNKLKYNQNQELFFNRIKLFLEGEKDFLINQGGMGLGKTKATIKTINKENIFIATPFSQIKNEWSKEFSPGNPGHKYSYNELKGEVIHESKELLLKIDSLKKETNGNK